MDINKEAEFEVRVYPETVTLFNSYLVSTKSEMRKIVQDFKSKFPDHIISKIPTYLLVAEWSVHNLFYKLNILRDRTAHTDLNANKKWYLNALYLIMSCFYWK